MLPLMLAIDAPAAIAPANGTYTYASTYQGQAVGRTTIVVTRTPAGTIVLSEAGGGSMSGMNASLQDTLTLDAASLAPTNYVVNANMAGQTGQERAVFNGAQAQISGTRGAQTFSLGTGASHFALIDFGPFSGYFALPAQIAAWHGAPFTAVVPLADEATTLTPDGAMKPARPKNVPAADAQVSFSTPLQITLWYDPKSLVVDQVDLPTQNVQVTRQP
jgi:hypothetical protein